VPRGDEVPAALEADGEDEQREEDAQLLAAQAGGGVAAGGDGGGRVRCEAKPTDRRRCCRSVADRRHEEPADAARSGAATKARGRAPDAIALADGSGIHQPF
jgi:hypothetical protein